MQQLALTTLTNKKYSASKSDAVITETTIWDIRHWLSCWAADVKNMDKSVLSVGDCHEKILKNCHLG